MGLSTFIVNAQFQIVGVTTKSRSSVGGLDYAWQSMAFEIRQNPFLSF